MFKNNSRATRLSLLGVLSLIFLLGLSACGGKENTINVEPTLDISNDAGDMIMALDLDDPATYAEVAGNYTVTMDFNFSAEVEGGKLYREVNIEGQRGVNPDASSYIMTPNDAAIMNGIEYMHMADVAGTSYIYSTIAGCQRLAYTDFSGPFDSLVKEGGILQGTAPLVGSGEIVNGVITDIYRLSLENLTVEDTVSWDFSEVTSGALFIAREDRTIVRLVLEGSGTSQFLSGDPALIGNIHYQVDFVTTDEVYDIQIPEQCSAALTPDDIDWPMMHDAQNAQIMSGLFIYLSESPIDTIVDFYYAEMTESGYTLINEQLNSDSGQASIIFYSEEKGMVQLAIQPNNAGIGFIIAIGQP